MNKIVWACRIGVPAIAVILFYQGGLCSVNRASSIDHYSDLGAFAAWSLLPYGLWIITGLMKPQATSFLTSGMIILLFSLTIHIRVAVSAPRLNAFSLLVGPLIQIGLLLLTYALFALATKVRQTSESSRR